MVSMVLVQGLEPEADHLSGVRKNVGDQLCLVGGSGGEIW